MFGRLLTLRVVAEQTSFSRSTLYRWCATGRLPAVRVGRSLRIRESDLRAMIEGRQAPVPSQRADRAPWANLPVGRIAHEQTT
jgi:excisionase family DNA binding protein